nr:biotin/lipoyl-containing protein [Brevundimonas sp.]
MILIASARQQWLSNPRRDLLAGTVIALALIPEAISFSIIAGVDPAVAQEVKAGETVAVIEPMKMQNILKAERDGVVKVVGAKAGDPVAADHVLVEFG